jgi:hypothetical protein
MVASGTGAPIGFRLAGAIAHQPARLDEFAHHVDGGDSLASGKRDKLPALSDEQRPRPDQERSRPRSRNGREGTGGVRHGYLRHPAEVKLNLNRSVRHDE